MAADVTRFGSEEELAAWATAQGKKLAALEKSDAEKAVIIERMAADLKSAQQALSTVAAQKSAAPDLSGSDRDLAAFIVDGRIVARSYDKADSRVRARSLPGLLDSKPIHGWQADMQKALEDHTLAITAIHGAAALGSAPLHDLGRPTRPSRPSGAAPPRASARPSTPRPAPAATSSRPRCSPPPCGRWRSTTPTAS